MFDSIQPEMLAFRYGLLFAYKATFLRRDGIIPGARLLPRFIEIAFLNFLLLIFFRIKRTEREK